MNRNIIQIAIAADSNYLMQAFVVLKSLFVNNSSNSININFLYIPSLTKEEDLNKIRNYVINHNQNFTELKISDEYLDIFPETRHSKNTFLRLLLPILLPDLDKILYLDSDIIIKGDLLDLYNTDIDNYYVGAVKEVAHIYNYLRLKELLVEDGYFCFGAGVILMNLKMMREDNIFDKFIDVLKYKKEILNSADQDVLIYVLWKKVRYLHPKFNFNFLVEKDVVSKVWSKNELQEVYSNPVIVHYIGPVKPWSYLSFHPKTSLWWQYLKLTPYFNYKPKDKNISNFFKRLYLSPIKRFERTLTLSQKQKFGRLIPTNIKSSFKRVMLKK
jgi:lipopolysaccharide biosynthesis glycosyltransferase